MLMSSGCMTGNRIANEQIYQRLQDTYFCFRRLNATHETGCQCKQKEW